MILVQRFLGLCAQLYEVTSRMHLHVLPGSWAILIFSFLFVSWSAERLDDSRANAVGPRTCTVAEFFRHGHEFKNNQAVTISGTWKPAEALYMTPTGARSDSQYLVPLSDEKGERIVMVAAVKPASISRQTTNLQVSGILRACTEQTLAEYGKWPSSRGLLERRFYLDSSSAPGHTLIDALVMLGALSLCSVWCVVMFKRGVIFERTASATFDAAAVHAPPTESLGLRASGKFRSGNASYRFLDTEVTLLERPDGARVLVTSTEGVTGFFGFNRQRVVVTWELRLTPARSIVPGHQYYGTQRRFAVRYKGQGGERVVISFRSEADRARIAHDLVAKRELAA